MIRVFDAFAGIGGFRSALEQVGGFKVVGWCEIDKYAQKAYRALYDTGGEQFYENIRDIDTGGLVDFDLLVGGRGARAGDFAPYFCVYSEVYFRGANSCVKKCWILKYAERKIAQKTARVSGITIREIFKNIIQRLSELGYCIEWQLCQRGRMPSARLPVSAAVVPQTRKRVYIVGCLGADCTGKILSF